jgi:hypothetical protein
MVRPTRGWDVAVLAAALICGSAADATTIVMPNAQPTPAQAAAVDRAVAPDMRGGHFAVGMGDLNGDGRPDLIALYEGGMWRGSGGCSSAAVLATSTGYAKKGIDLPNFNDRVTILAAVHRGMHDLEFDDADHVFRWTGATYR